MIYLKIDGIDGECQADAYKGYTTALSYGFITTSKDAHGAAMNERAGVVATVPNITGLSVSLYLDTTTPNLMAACLEGKQFNNAKLVAVHQAAKGSVAILELALEEVTVTQCNQAGGQDLRVDCVLNFKRVKQTTRNLDGTKNSAFGWDLQKNKRL